MALIELLEAQFGWEMGEFFDHVHIARVGSVDDRVLIRLQLDHSVME